MALIQQNQAKLYKLQEHNGYSEFPLDIEDISFKITISPEIVFCQSNDINTDSINIILSCMDIDKANIDKIVNTIKNYLVSRKNLSTNISDKLNIFSTQKAVTKHNINKKELYSNYLKSQKLSSKVVDAIPKELLLSNEQIYNLIVTEIENLNKNMSCDHYITCNNNNPFDLSIRIKFTDDKIGEKLVQLKESHDFDYFELRFKLNPNLYPFQPPSVEYVKPKVNINLISNILNLDIWDIKNWNYTISLDKLVINMAEKLKPYLNDNFTITDDIIFTPLEQKLMVFNKKTKEQSFDDMNIKLDFSKLMKEKTSSAKYWSSGVGYGTGNGPQWNIEAFLASQEREMEDIISLIEEISEEISSEIEKGNNVTSIFTSGISSYTIKQFKSTNLLDFNKQYNLFQNLFMVLKLLITEVSNEDFTKQIYESANDLYSEIKMILDDNEISNTIEENILDTYLNFVSIFELYKEKAIIKEETKIEKYVVSSNINDQYLDLVRKHQFMNEDLSSKHRFYKYKNEKLESKSILRVMSEISSLRKNLPVNWDSSILMRVPKGNANLITFCIIGPKDTPYHNGVFEFHAYFPDTYPKIVPKVLLDTTDGGRVRFNPNLYNCGKVCLSLLGTWSGEKGESWNPKLSTFLQVLISIQSLIMVENPYFNEPSYEKSMHTEHGKAKSFDYTDNIRLETIRVAMIGSIKNTTNSYKDFIKDHFRIKKDEIYQTIETWISESTKRKVELKSAYNDLKFLLDK